jgi:hypothetical protein
MMASEHRPAADARTDDTYVTFNRCESLSGTTLAIMDGMS